MPETIAFNSMILVLITVVVPVVVLAWYGLRDD